MAGYGHRGTVRDTRFDGCIAGLGTVAGLRVVVGHWPRSPFGSFSDVMVELADGHRVLLAPSAEVADFVASTYRFDEVRVVPVTVTVAAASGGRLPGGGVAEARSLTGGGLVEGRSLSAGGVVESRRLPGGGVVEGRGLPGDRRRRAAPGSGTGRGGRWTPGRWP